MLQSSTVASFNLGGGVGGFGVFGLIGGRLLGQTVSATYLARKTWLENRISKKEIKKSKIITLAKKYKNFTYFNLPNTVVDQVRTNGINILLNGIFSANILGFYFIALNIIQMPSSIMGASISQVFYQKISKIDDINIMRQLVKKFMAKAFLLAIVPFSLVFLFSEEVFGFVFGSEWSVAGKFAEILAPWVLINFITSPLSSVFVKLNKMNLQLYFAIVYCLVPISVILIGSYLKLDIYTVLSIMSLSMVILLLLYIKLMLSVLKKNLL